MTTITNPSATRFQAIMLRSHIKLMSLGMRHSSLRQRDVLKAIGRITGKTYAASANGRAAALEDINNCIEQSKKGDAQ